jgi:hypothetical protein
VFKVLVNREPYVQELGNFSPHREKIKTDRERRI